METLGYLIGWSWAVVELFWGTRDFPWERIKSFSTSKLLVHELHSEHYCDDQISKAKEDAGRDFHEGEATQKFTAQRTKFFPHIPSTLSHGANPITIICWTVPNGWILTRLNVITCQGQILSLSHWIRKRLKKRNYKITGQQVIENTDSMKVEFLLTISSNTLPAGSYQFPKSLEHNTETLTVVEQLPEIFVFVLHLHLRLRLLRAYD